MEKFNLAEVTPDMPSVSRSNTTELAPTPKMIFLVLKSFSLFLLCAWTVFANGLVFVVLKKNPKLRTVPNYLVANLAFSDFCLGLLVLPLSAIYTVTMRWQFGRSLCELWLSADILICTSSIWNLSIIGFDRYMAITKPVAYMGKRTTRLAAYLIGAVWSLSTFISVAPFIGWKAFSQTGNYIVRNNALTGKQEYHCVHFEDLISYTIYSAVGSFYIPLTLMFYLYYRIYRGFVDHQQRQAYRQNVIRKHLESTILHDLSQVQPEAKVEEGMASSSSSSDGDEESDVSQNELYDLCTTVTAALVPITAAAEVVEPETEAADDTDDPEEDQENHITVTENRFVTLQSMKAGLLPVEGEGLILEPNLDRRASQLAALLEPVPKITRRASRASRVAGGSISSAVSTTSRATNKTQQQPVQGAKISASKEKRGIKVLGIILGCFTVCWTPFFIMYLVAIVDENVSINQHVEQFITWLGYANSAMNPIIYTVFNKDYYNAVRRLFAPHSHGLGLSRMNTIVR